MLFSHVHTGIARFDDVALLPNPTLIDDDRAGFGFDIVGEFPDPVEIGIAEALISSLVSVVLPIVSVLKNSWRRSRLVRISVTP